MDNKKNKFKCPNGERVVVRYYNRNSDLSFVLTTKEKFGEFYFLYKYENGALKKLGRSTFPPELERKFNIDKVIKQ